MSKQRRKRLNRNKRTRSRRTFIRNGIEQLESRALPGGFLDLLAGAAVASYFELLPEEQLAPEEIESEFDGYTLRHQSAVALLQTDFSLPDHDLEQTPQPVNLTPAGGDLEIASPLRVTASTLAAASLVDSFFASNQLVDTPSSSSFSIPQSIPLATRSFSSSISQLGAGVVSGSGQSYDIGGTELLDSSTGHSSQGAPSLPAWMLGEGEGASGPSGPSGPTGGSSPSGPTGGSSPTGPTGGSGPTGPTGGSGPSGPTGGTTTTGPSCTTGGSAPASTTASVFEGDDLTVLGSVPAPWMSVDVSADGLNSSSFSQGQAVVLNFFDDEVSGTPQDVVTVTAVWNHECGTQVTTTFDVTVKNKDPDAVDDTAETDEDTAIQVEVLSNDTDPGMMDTLTVVSVDDSGTTGKVTLDSGMITYDPDGKFEALKNGDTATDSFSYTMEDDDTGSSTATVTVTITGVTDMYEVSISGDKATQELKRAPLDSDLGEFTISLDKEVHASNAPLTISFSPIETATDDATNGTDYTIRGGTSVTFQAGESSKTVKIEPINDNKGEGHENIRLILDDPTGDNVTLGTTQASIGIGDNDYWDWDDHTGNDLDFPQTDAQGNVTENPYPFVSGPLEFAPSLWTISSASYLTASAHSHVIEDTGWTVLPWTWGNFESYSAGDKQTVDCELDFFDGTITCLVTGDSSELQTHGRASAAVGVDVTVDNTGDTQHTVDVAFNLYAGADYTYTTTASAEIGGEIGIKKGKVTGSIGVSTTVNGSHTMEKKLNTQYQLKASIHELDDPPAP